MWVPWLARLVFGYKPKNDSGLEEHLLQDEPNGVPKGLIGLSSHSAQSLDQLGNCKEPRLSGS